jgi:hypothetical protein
MIKSRRMRRAGHVARNGNEKNNVYRFLAGVPEGKRPLGRPRRGREEKVKINTRVVRMGWYGRFI